MTGLDPNSALSIARTRLCDVNGNPLTVDDDTWNPVSMTPQHSKTHEGEHFYVKGWVDVTGVGTKVEALVITPDTAEWAHFSNLQAAEAEFTIEVFRGATYSDIGTEIPSINNNENSLNRATTKVYIGPTILTDGFSIWPGKMGSGKDATNERSILGEIVGRQNTVYLVRFTLVPAGGPFWLDFYFTWYEHINKHLI